MNRTKAIVLSTVLAVLVAGSVVGLLWYRDDQLYQLLTAAGSGNTEEVITLVKSGAPVNGRFGGDGDTPLHRAAAVGATSVVEALLTNGANANAVNEQGSTPLLFASYRGHTDTATVLLRAGADPDMAETRFGTTPLIDAARKGYSELVRLLLAHGANPSITDKAGETALDKARHRGHQEIVAVILARGK